MSDQQLSSEEIENIKIFLNQSFNLEVVDDPEYDGRSQSLILCKHQEKEYLASVQNYLERNTDILIENGNKTNEIIKNNFPFLSWQEYTFFGKYQIRLRKKFETLRQFINEQKNLSLKEEEFLSIAIIISICIKYLNEYEFKVGRLNLDTIQIFDPYSVYLYDYMKSNCFSERIELQKEINSYEDSQQKFYLPPEIRRHVHSDLSLQNVDTEKKVIWQLGISLYLLAGASFSSAEDLSLGFSLYQPLLNIGENINQILSQMLLSDPKQRPSIDQILNQFNSLYRDIIEIKRAPQSEEEQTLLLKAQSEITSFSYEESIKTLERLIELNEKNDLYNQMMGFSYLELEQFEESSTWNQKCIKLNSLSDGVFSNYAYVLYREQSYLIAKSYAIISHYLNPNNHWALLILSFLTDEQKDFHEGRKLVEKAMQIKPNCAFTLYQYGNILYELGDYENSLQQYKKSGRIHPQNISNYWSMFSCYYQQKKKQHAINTLKQIENKWADKKNSVEENMAAIYFQHNCYEKAIKYYNNQNQTQELVKTKSAI